MDNLLLIFTFLLAAGADFCFADELFRSFHPVVGIGALINRLENFLYPVNENKKREFFAGLMITMLIVFISYLGTRALLKLSILLGPVFYYPLYFYLIYSAIACGGLARAAENVLDSLRHGGLSAGRRAVSRIVGRETEQLEEEDIYRAVVETVAENLSDGVIAPLFYLALGGVPLMWAYKAVNTLDSMLGYKDRRYLYFGRSAAYLDDLANFIPARISAGLILAAGFLQGLNVASGWRILVRDRRAHASPNSGYPEAAMAGLLGIRLGGDNRYHGQLVHKPFIGDARENISPLHVLRSVHNLYISSAIFVLIMLFLCF